MGAFSVRRVTLLGSVNGEVVRILIATGALLAYLHAHVVEERRRSDAIPIRCEPRETQRLVHLHQELDGLLALPDPAGDLPTADASGPLAHATEPFRHC